MKNAIAIWNCTDVFGLSHIAYLKAYGDNLYKLMSHKEDRRDKQLQPKGNEYFVIRPDELTGILNKIEAYLAQHSLTVQRV